MMFLRMLLLTQVWESCNLTQKIQHSCLLSVTFRTLLVVYTALFLRILTTYLFTDRHFYFFYIA